MKMNKIFKTIKNQELIHMKIMKEKKNNKFINLQKINQ